MMRGLVPFAASVVLCGAIVTAAGQAPTQPPAAPPADNAAVPEWLPKELKNLKVLPKDIEPKQLLVVMRGFTQAMGVRCVYCHVAGPDPSDMSSYNFDSDRKESKETTRAMLKYTDAVNEAFPKGVGEEAKAGAQRVTCYTCHQGKREPPTKKPDGPAATGTPPPQGQAPRPPGI